MFNSGFPSSSTSSPFGAQSAFKSNTGFGSSVFGSAPGNSLFSGATTQQSGGLFGSSTVTQTFGQPQTTQPAFGSTGGLFGTQQNATPSTGGIFGSTTTSAFGQSKPFGFGTQQQSTSLFGQQAQPAQTQQTSLFGQAAAQSASGLFSSTTGFSGAATGGTTIKFTPVTGTDTMVKNGSSTNINTRHHCITCMKEYENKSLEELRLEDYAANRKGVQQGAQGSMGLFGSTGQSTTLFGSANTSAFGAGTSGGVFGSGATGNSLFSKPAGTATAFGAPASTSTSTFGFNSATPSNPFGANTAQKPFGATTPQAGLFGQTTQASSGFGTQPTTGFGGFGTQQNTGGLFGANKSTFSLGNTNTNTAFSFNQPSTTNTGSNIFGAKPATSTFGGFGTPATTSAFGTSTFGTTNQNTSIFGNNFGKPATGFNFGTTPTTNTLGSGGLSLGGGSLFGNNAAKPGGLFGQTNTNLFGSNTFGNTGSTFNTGSNTLGGLGGGSLFGSGGQNSQQSLGSSQNSNPLSQHMLAYASMPFGDSPLFKNLLPQTGKTDELLKPTSPAAQKALITGQNFKASPKNNSKIKVIPIEATTKKSLFDGLEDDIDSGNDSFNQTVRQSPKRLILRSRPFNEISLNGRNLQISSNAINEMSPIIKTSPRFSLRTSQSTPVQSDVRENGENSGCSKLPLHIVKSQDTIPLENTMSELYPNKENDSSDVDAQQDNRAKNNESTLEEPASTNSVVESEAEEASNGAVEEHPARITLRRNGYYTIPKMDQLAQLVDSQGRCIVENFTIGRLNYGNLFFPDTMDVAGLNLDEIVHFRHKEVIVYPDDSNKPPIGEGLNRKAQVTLDRVWPVDKTTRLPITEPARIQALDYESLLRRVSAKNQTKFVEYRPQTGSWVFKVDHFSKYGLSDSDEEEAAGHETKKQKLSQPTLQGVLPPPFGVKQTAALLGPAASMQVADEDEDMDDGIRSPFDLDEKLESNALSPTTRLGRDTGTSSHKIQLMKASFFDQPDLNIDGEYLDYEDILEHPTYKVNGYSFDSKQLVEALSWYKTGSYEHTDSCMHIDQEEVGLPLRGTAVEKEELREEEFATILQPKVYVLKHWREVIPLSKTTGMRLKGKCLLDVGLLKGRSFPLKWGPLSQLLSISPASAVSPTEIFLGRSSEDTSPYVLHRLAISSSPPSSLETSFHDIIEPHLICALKHSVYEKSEDGCPHFTSKLGLLGLEEHCIVADQIRKSSNDPALNLTANIWGLCHALWGQLPFADKPDDSHLTLQQRKAAVSDWLKSVVAGRVSEEVKRIESLEENNESSKNAFSYLTGYQIPQACEAAQAIGDHQLSLLLSQCGSGPVVRGQAIQQLTQWRETEADHFIRTSRLKLFMLIAGMPTHQASDRLVNSCAGLDWLRTFAIHLWYISPLSGSLTDALLLYEKAFQSVNSSYAKPPFPSHPIGLVQEGENPVYDLQYHLLKLFSTKSHPLEQLLNPSTHTSDHLDYSLSWFLMRVLNSLGYSHASELATCIVHSSFAAQLEAHDLWHWAVFVLLHISDSHRRKNAVLDIISRHVSVENQSDQEDFLLNKIKVPVKWVFEAKAQKALFLQRYDDAAKFLIKAEVWNEAHSIIISHISSRAIINERYDYLESLLRELSKNNRSKEVSLWESAGGVLLEYLTVVREVEKMVADQDLSIGYHLERLHPQLTHLCHSIKLLQTDTAIDRLRQDEMTKRISGLIQNLMVAHSNDESPEGVLMLAQLVSQLPLAGDHSQWEWLRVMATWRNSATH